MKIAHFPPDHPFELAKRFRDSITDARAAQRAGKPLPFAWSASVAQQLNALSWRSLPSGSRCRELAAETSAAAGLGAEWTEARWTELQDVVDTVIAEQRSAVQSALRSAGDP